MATLGGQQQPTHAGAVVGTGASQWHIGRSSSAPSPYGVPVQPGRWPPGAAAPQAVAYSASAPLTAPHFSPLAAAPLHRASSQGTATGAPVPSAACWSSAHMTEQVTVATLADTPGSHRRTLSGVQALGSISPGQAPLSACSNSPRGATPAAPPRGALSPGPSLGAPSSMVGTPGVPHSPRWQAELEAYGVAAPAPGALSQGSSHGLMRRREEAADNKPLYDPALAAMLAGHAQGCFLQSGIISPQSLDGSHASVRSSSASPRTRASHSHSSPLPASQAHIFGAPGTPTTSNVTPRLTPRGSGSMILPEGSARYPSHTHGGPISTATTPRPTRVEEGAPLPPARSSRDGAVSVRDAHEGSMMPTPRSQLPSPRDSRASSGERGRKAWAPAGTRSTVSGLFGLNFDQDRERLSNRASTPTSRSRSNLEDRFSSLYNDAAARHRRLQVKREEAERSLETVNGVPLGSPRQLARSRSSSRDTPRGERHGFWRSMHERSEEHCAKRKELQEAGERERRVQEAKRIEECTFRPNLIASSELQKYPNQSLAVSMSEERGMVMRLRQLGRKQFSIQARFAELERERRLSRDKVKAEFARRMDELHLERNQQAAQFLSRNEGRVFLNMREDELVSQGLGKEAARKQAYGEVVRDMNQKHQRLAAEELEPQFRQAERDFQTKSRVLVEALNNIEARGESTVQALQALSEGELLLRSTGFAVGLAAQALEWFIGEQQVQPDQSLEAVSKAGGEAMSRQHTKSSGSVAKARSEAHSRTASAYAGAGDAAAGSGSGSASASRGSLALSLLVPCGPLRADAATSAPQVTSNARMSEMGNMDEYRKLEDMLHPQRPQVPFMEGHGAIRSPDNAAPAAEAPEAMAKPCNQQ